MNKKEKCELAIKLGYRILQRKDINTEEKIIISYLLALQSSNKFCFETQNDLSNKLGISTRTLKRTIQLLKDKNVMFTSNDRKYLLPFGNRKAIILCDKNNPLPNSTEKKSII